MALMIFHHHFFSDPQIIQFGTLPVAFFFILSGFVMAIGYADKVKSGDFSYKNFIIKRLIKLLPLNTICLVMWLILPVISDFLNGCVSYSRYLYALPDLFLVQAWVPIKQIYFSGNDVAWFLSDMLFCYLMFPLLVKILKSKIGIFLVLVLVIAYLLLIGHIEGDNIHYYIYINPLFRLIDFMIGIILFQMVSFAKVEDKKPLLGTSLEIIAITIVVLSLLYFPLITLQYSSVSFYWIPSIILITAFALSSRLGGGNFLYSQPTIFSLSRNIKFSILYGSQNCNRLVWGSGVENYFARFSSVRGSYLYYNNDIDGSSLYTTNRASDSF